MLNGRQEMTGKKAYCNCSERRAITAGVEDDFGYWDVCIGCGKKIEDGYHFYNHYDGEDHEVFWDRMVIFWSNMSWLKMIVFVKRQDI